MKWQLVPHLVVGSVWRSCGTRVPYIYLPSSRIWNERVRLVRERCLYSSREPIHTRACANRATVVLVLAQLTSNAPLSLVHGAVWVEYAHGPQVLTRRIFLRSSIDGGCCIQESGKGIMRQQRYHNASACSVYVCVQITRYILLNVKLAKHPMTQRRYLIQYHRFSDRGVGRLTPARRIRGSFAPSPAQAHSLPLRPGYERSRVVHEGFDAHSNVESWILRNVHAMSTTSRRRPMTYDRLFASC